MKTLYLDCSMGAAGDMLTGALLELLPEPDRFLDELNALDIPGVLFRQERSVKCGITGTHISVTVHGEEEREHNHEHDHNCNHGHSHAHDHHHSSMQQIEQIISGLPVSDKVQADVLAVYRQIAKAESEVHGVPVTEIHFHEVGTMDAIADVTAVALLMEKLAPEQVIVSPVHVGSGQVHCAHGILPVPAPATAKILQGVPIYGGSISGELCTPTGAALLKHFATSFGDMPVMVTESIGYGMGSKDFPSANCVRAFLGNTGSEQCEIYELNCNVDDMTGEEIGFAMERLFEAGASEVFTVPVGMKKNRPGTLLYVLCTDNQRDNMVEAIFRYTSTIGIRESKCHRYVLERSISTAHTPCGDVRYKQSVGYGVRRCKYEYDDLAEIARKNRISLSEAVRRIGNTCTVEETGEIG